MIIKLYNDLYCKFSLHSLKYLEKKRKIRVLALFDGIGTRKVFIHITAITWHLINHLYWIISVVCPLKNLGFEIEKYFAAEIDPTAIAVVYHNHGNLVENVEDVRKLTGKKLKDLERIDFLFGGSPCNDLSKVNHKRKGLDGIKSKCLLLSSYYCFEMYYSNKMNVITKFRMIDLFKKVLKLENRGSFFPCNGHKTSN